MSMPGYGPWARLAYFRGSSEKGERVRGLIVPSVVDDKKLLGAGTQTNDYSFGRDKTLSLPQCAVTS